MSFFGFDATLPRDRGHSAHAPGFGQTPDAFAGLGGGAAADDDDAIDFDDTYDGLGDRLDEADDAFNDDTFGRGPASQQSIGKDFDFAGQTSKISNTIQEEQMLYQARQAPSQQRAQPQHQHQHQPPKPSKPSRTGYESYHDPNYIPQLEARADIWGLKPKQPTAPTRPPENQAPPPEPQPARKIVSLEEVEAMIRAQTLQQERAAMQMQQQQQQQAQQSQPPHVPAYPQQQVPHGQLHFPGIPGQGQFVPHILQRPQQVQQQAQQQPPQQRSGSRPQQVHAELPAHSVQTPPTQHPTILQRQRPPPNDPAIQQQRNAQPQSAPQRPPSQPRQILQNPSRLSGQGQSMVQPGMQAPQGPRGSGHNRGPSYPGMVVTNPEQLLHLSKEDREAFLAEDAKRAKRNHKIAQLSKDNGLMTPQDKNFITRIQLQQLMTATGNLDEQSPETVLAEDFYYQVFSQIRGAPRQTPHQPASQFAQTYLFQTNNRYGAGRRQGRGADNHMQRMEQQVQRAVEAAKAKPKAKQLTIEGSLGKISFSNSKTPRPLLSMKRPVSHDQHPHKPKVSVADRKETLRNIENVYMTLMRMEDHERTIPGQLSQDSSPEVIQKHMEWRTKIEALHKQLWEDIKIMEPINPASLTPHPFIAILSHAKGKKAIPRIFRHIDEQERITILTMVVVHLDKLNVVSHGVATPEQPLSPAMRDEIELFLHSVVPPLYAHIFESPLNIIIGLLGLILERTNVHIVARTKVGMSLLIMLISRAELLKEPPEINVVDWENWTTLYNRLFDSVEPVLPAIFPGSINDTDDMYVWQFLAAMGVGASPEQQQRLVLGVKDRVMETVGVSKALPPEMASARLANVNLFMRAIGLDVELLG
ncbi:topoisomerase II-associated protein PAT1 [Clohesyomyces aquaticus]|uniref:Topoisomerase II-associated protein PAT1 n=1 Tax=Clohesyomyces aquaticus TaxID=1231657 RepID=A0A1Y1YCT8_9PLEO|nr:topoisomerase II-associated protein PAT1 [Clohesyomyces aquaticus]